MMFCISVCLGELAVVMAATSSRYPMAPGTDCWQSSCGAKKRPGWCAYFSEYRRALDFLL